MTTIRNQFHARGLPADFQRCQCEACVAGRARQNADDGTHDDEPLAITSNRLRAIAKSQVRGELKKDGTRYIVIDDDGDDAITLEADDAPTDAEIVENAMSSGSLADAADVVRRRLNANAQRRRRQRAGQAQRTDFAPPDDSLAAATAAARRQRMALR
jgi:hypothetical protein